MIAPTTSPCTSCGNPSDAARFVAAWLSGNRSPSLGHLLDAAKLASELALADADAAAALASDAKARLDVATALAATARSRADQEKADASKAASLPAVVADQVKASAVEAEASAVAAEAAVTAIAPELEALTNRANDLASEAARITAESFTAADLRSAYDELGVTEDQGPASIQLYPIDHPTAAQARARQLLGFRG